MDADADATTHVGAHPRANIDSFDVCLHLFFLYLMHIVWVGLVILDVVVHTKQPVAKKNRCDLTRCVIIWVYVHKTCSMFFRVL